MAAMSTTSSATHAEAMQTLDHVYDRRPDGYLGIVPCCSIQLSANCSAI